MLTFWLHHKLPYRKMLVLTGVLLAVVLVVMTGGTALTFQDLGWLPATPLPFAMPGWLGAWFEVYGTYETIACQLAAAILVVGSYVLAEQMKVRRPATQGARRAARRDAAGLASASRPISSAPWSTRGSWSASCYDVGRRLWKGHALLVAAPAEGARRQGDGPRVARRRAQGGAVPLRRRGAGLPQPRRPRHAT